MAIEKIPSWALTDSRPAFYDAESVTVTEAVAKMHSKINETVEAFNDHEEDVNHRIEGHEQTTAEQIEIFETGMRQEFQDFIDTVEVKLQGGGTNPNTSTLLTKQVLFEGSANITANSTTTQGITSSLNLTNFDYFDVVIEYGGYCLDKTAVRCYPCTLTTGTKQAISGHLSWFYTYWLSLDIMILSNGNCQIGCVYREPSSSSFNPGSNTFTITKITGYKFM